MESSPGVADEDRIPITEWPVSAPRSCNHDGIGLDCSRLSKPTQQNPGHTDQQILSTAEVSLADADEPKSKKARIAVNLSENVRSYHGGEVHQPAETPFVTAGMQCHELTERAECLGQIRVARWWRRNRHLKLITLPESNNPNTVLFHVSRSKECRNFLSEEKRKLSLKATLHKGQADLYAAIASIDDWLADYSSALEYISLAVQLEPKCSEYRWLKAKLQRQCKMNKIQTEKMKILKTAALKYPSLQEVERISSRDLTVEEFIREYVQKKRPVIILDIVNEMTPGLWDFDLVKSKAGSIRVTVKHAVPESVEWARLEESRETTVREFIDQVQMDETSDYLFDWSLPLHCPQLANELTLPKYFSNNFLQKTEPGSLYHDSWPSLFIAPKGAVSSLHIDAFASNFWMALFQGQKRWTFFDAEDVPLLYPCYVHSMDPVFNVDLSNPDVQRFPLLTLTRPRQCVLNPGELLFVPAGSPHFVENLTMSLAVSSNHVDHSNFKEVCEELRISGLLDPRAADLLQQMEKPEFMQENMTA